MRDPLATPPVPFISPLIQAYPPYLKGEQGGISAQRTKTNPSEEIHGIDKDIGGRSGMGVIGASPDYVSEDDDDDARRESDKESE